ncbi:sortase, partial [Clavibacter michiganensis]
MTRPTPAASRGRSFRRAAAGACLSASLVILPLAMAPAAHAETVPVDSAPVAVEAPVEAPVATPTPEAEAPAPVDEAAPTPAPTEVPEEGAPAPVVDAPVESTPAPT